MSQTYPRKEIICSNDTGSWEGYADSLVDSVEVSYVVGVYEGPSLNYMTLLDSARGKYVIFLDDDDYFIHDKVLDEYMRAFAKTLNPIACMGGYFIPHHGVKKLVYNPGWEANFFLTNIFKDTNDFQLAQVMFDKKYIEDYDFATLKDWPENDVAMFQWALCNKGNVGFTNSFTYVLGINDDNMTWGKDIKYHFEWLDMIMKRMKEKNIPKYAIEDWLNNMLKNHEFY